jgi:predicted molibdopterin-dependent oxidoreductase YjgC
MHLQRLRTPLIRVDGELQPTSWDTALDEVARRFAVARPEGAQRFGLFSCSKATNEVNYAAQRFTRAVMGSNNVDSCNRT